MLFREFSKKLFGACKYFSIVALKIEKNLDQFRICHVYLFFI